MVTNAYLSLSLFVLFKYGRGQMDVYDPCTVQATNKDGICQQLSFCMQAREDLKNNIYPQICRYRGTEPVVCCVTAGSAQISNTTTPRTTTTRTTTRCTTSPTLTFTGFGAKSRQRCVEYSQYIYEEELPAVLIRTGPVRVEYCAQVPIENIVGGTQTKRREFPHMALIGFDGENNQVLWQCGGTLISDEFILTAAHCLYDHQWGEPKYVRIGELQLDTNTNIAQIQDFNIIERIRHPDYLPPSQYNDIALLRLNRKARLNSFARPACLNVNSAIPVRKSVASGWDKVGYAADVSKHLLKVTLEFFTNAECNNTYRRNIGIRLRNGIVDASQVCAGHHGKAKDTCQGDSGGPLQIVHQDVYCMYSIVGITSFGKACGVANMPGVYTRVSNYIDWIEDIVWPN